MSHKDRGRYFPRDLIKNLETPAKTGRVGRYGLVLDNFRVRKQPKVQKRKHDLASNIAKNQQNSGKC